MEKRIKIISESLPIHRIKKLLEAETGWNNSEVSLLVKSRLRSSIDPAIMVAIIGATGAGLAALISGLLQIVKNSSVKKFVFVGRHRRLEVPADTPLEEIDILLQKVTKLDIDEIIIP
jgi:hypothetical protein